MYFILFSLTSTMNFCCIFISCTKVTLWAKYIPILFYFIMCVHCAGSASEKLPRVRPAQSRSQVKTKTKGAYCTVACRLVNLFPVGTKWHRILIIILNNSEFIYCVVLSFHGGECPTIKTRGGTVVIIFRIWYNAYCFLGFSIIFCKFVFECYSTREWIQSIIEKF